MFRHEKEWLSSFSKDAVKAVLGTNCQTIQDICDQPHEDGPFTIRFNSWNGKPDNLDKDKLLEILNKVSLVQRILVYKMIKENFPNIHNLKNKEEF